MRLDCSCGRPTCRRPSTKPGCYQIRPVAASTSGGGVLFSPTLAEQWCTGLPWLNRTWPNSNYSDTNELTSWTWLTLMSLNTASGTACVCVWVRVGLCVFRRRRRKRNFPSFRYGNLKIFDKREAARTVEWGGPRGFPGMKTNVVVVRFLMKLFKTVNNEIIRECCSYFKFTLPSELLDKRRDKFQSNFMLRCGMLHYFGIKT